MIQTRLRAKKESWGNGSGARHKGKDIHVLVRTHGRQANQSRFGECSDFQQYPTQENLPYGPCFLMDSSWAVRVLGQEQSH
jgi:hypothetical protein